MKKKCAANKLFVRIIFCLLFVFSITTGAAAQDVEQIGKNEIEIWGGISPDSSTLFKGIGRTPDARFAIAAVRYSRRFKTSALVNLKYTIDAIPLAVLGDNKFSFLPTGSNEFRGEDTRQTYYGFGTAPLGLQINFRPRHKIQPFIGGSGGLLYFNKTLQNNLGKQFNFTADIGGGAEIRLSRGRAVTVGYKYFHISNGKRGIVNPGIDNNLFYVGYSFSR